ncbi:hypothetical protein [Streptomyces ipomoeae]|uniref:hypothetical protein n=1 Tax=Streptomyces ipomoeae TaxID=103232 RepID=UPI0015F10CC8|nr:hypothetical protein [Streptomyces ipomoeae]MDX2936485.1 hypothetical protein [Streptomyces ipomoeae]
METAQMVQVEVAWRSVSVHLKKAGTRDVGLSGGERGGVGDAEAIAQDAVR